VATLLAAFRDSVLQAEVAGDDAEGDDADDSSRAYEAATA
jgi:hypothetical protein